MPVRVVVTAGTTADCTQAVALIVTVLQLSFYWRIEVMTAMRLLTKR